MYYQAMDAIVEGFSKCSSSGSKSLESFSGHMEEPDENLYHLHLSTYIWNDQFNALSVKYNFVPLVMCTNSYQY